MGLYLGGPAECSFYSIRDSAYYTSSLEDDVGGVEFVVFLVLAKAWSSPSRKEKNTSTAYPTRKAIAKGGIEAPCVIVKLLNSPTTAPPIAAMRKRAELATDGTNVRVAICWSKVRKR